ncbi:hypothetical protein CXB49_14900 [Chromobacterium sp. ATCC 53434]|uniref:hypothetical protein n=1 Tax=Chromobacterium sp. (strain ATCC 53434 / SC 14030) TaxID=2059672 RepID=UPI000C7852D2|nr:hypothetical protein [Chromobacterium sp. ATCC 53434]AUH52013.1 hypothetical protein CXB49_14900 [Chromobacterium sp. ATCC 53434]
MQDNVPNFLAGPATFIVPNPITLAQIAQSMPGGALPAVNNLRTRFTLTTDTGTGGLPLPGALPKLRMQPVGGPPTVTLPPPGGVVTTIDAQYCHASAGGTALAALPFCDIPVAPGPADARTLFTTGMNGCSLMVLSAVPVGAPALAAGHLRVVHDHDHRSLATWAAAGYTVRFAAYADGGTGAGAPPGGWPVPALVADYNPHNYPWGMPVPGQAVPGARVVTNFLYWTGANWTFNSRHYVDFGGTPYDIDVPAGGGATSTQTMNI